MTNVRFRFAWGIGGILLCLIAIAPVIVRAQPARPNVVLIMSDDAGYADFGFMNQFTGKQTPLKTPNLNQLASQSVAFSNAVLPSSICAITRAGLLTGRHPDSFGFSFNALPEDTPYEGLPVAQKTVIERVKELGYTTGLVGKWHQGEQPQWQPQNRGVDSFYGILEAGVTSYYRDDASTVKVRRGNTPIDWWSEPSFNNTLNDPTRGRYLTDAFGDEASKFVAEKAGGEEPFFLYAALNAPHGPYTSKAQDDAQFAGSGLTGSRRALAAMTYGMDRAIGNILHRIDDPNNDGDQSDSVADNTIVIFLNDNGGANANYDNGPLTGYKASGYEGGIRTPMLIRAPNLSPGVFAESVTALDLFPTIVAAAGAEMTTPTNGVDLMPYLSGEQSGPVHKATYFRNRVNFAGIRKGEWKFTRPNTASTWKLFRLNADGSGEDVDLAYQYPEVVAELIKDYVAFDVTLDKARNSGPSKVRNYDTFVRHNDGFTDSKWGFSNSWRNGDNISQTAGIGWDDPNPNMVLVFNPNNNQNYRSTNNLNRASGINPTKLAQGIQDYPGLGEVMLNEIRFEGAFTGSANRKATIDGKTLMLVKNLAGKLPGLRLDAMQTGAFAYTYNLDLNMYLYHDFVIEGNGNASFRIGGVMSSFDQPSGIRKLGTSVVTFAGHNAFTGAAIVEAGRVIIDGANASIDGASEVRVDPGARLTLQNGLISTARFDVNAGQFNFLGGTLEAQEVMGNLTNNVGKVVIGGRPLENLVTGNFVQTGGILHAIVQGHAAEPTTTLMSVAGQAQLGGKLEIEYDGGTPFSIGSSLKILEAEGGILGAFSQVTFSTWLVGSRFQISYASNSVLLTRLANSVGFNSADFDLDGDVDGNDFLTWQRTLGATGPDGDANGDGVVDSIDFASWRQQFGTLPPVVAVAQAVPEPSSALLALIVLIAGGRVACPIGRIRRVEVVV